MVCIRFVIVAITVLILGVNRGLWQFSDIAPYILGGLIGGIPTALFYIFKPSNNASRITEASSVRLIQIPTLNYGRICVRKNSQRMFGGVMDTSNYFTEIVNSVPKAIHEIYD
jgi:hypothetical protein